jgi:precorrin-3B methylase
MALLYAVGPSDAARMTCEQKAAACEMRCARAYKNYTDCIYRTCTKQYGTCGKG